MKLIVIYYVLGLFFETVQTFVIQQFSFNIREKIHSRRFFSALPIDNLKIINTESYLKFEPTLDSSLTKLMNGLASCSVSNLSSDVDLITLSESCLPEDTIESASQFIYARRFYPELLKNIRKHKRVVLLSNPGTGKSIFQFYYLAKLLNPQAFKDLLPPDSTGSSEIPEVVIRQVGTHIMQIYFVKAKVVHLITTVSVGVLYCFDPKTTLYFFEPGESKVEPMWAGTTMSIFSCCSPDEIRYKEFCKNRGLKLYMPLFTISELQSIGKHMRAQPHFPCDLKSLYSKKGISNSYHHYGGIIRHVLPSSLEYVESIERMKNEAIEEADWLQYMKSPNIENSKISHFIVKYEVCRSTFKLLSYELINEEMKEIVAKKLETWTLSSLINILKYEKTNSLIIATQRYAYEDVIWTHLGEGAHFLVRDSIDGRFKKNRIHNYTDFSPRFSKKVREEAKFNDMKMDVLYKPTDPQFPFCDFYYKTKLNNDAPDGPNNVKLVAINTCFSVSDKSKNREFLALESFAERVKLPMKVHMDFMHCPHPSLADTAKVNLPDSNRTIGELILKTPTDFSSSF